MHRLWGSDDLRIVTDLSGRTADSGNGAVDPLSEVSRTAPPSRNALSVPGLRVDSRSQAKDGAHSMTSQLESQALQSAAFLVAAIADRRLGSTRLSDELKDAIEILGGELDKLGLLADYRQSDGTLVAWPPDEDGNIAAVLRRAGALDNKPSDLPRSYRVML